MDLDGMFGSPSATHSFAGRARPFDDAGAPYVLVSHPVPPGSIVRSLEDFTRLVPKASADDRAEVEALLFNVPCVHVIPRC
jgi:hypothetical protein